MAADSGQYGKLLYETINNVYFDEYKALPEQYTKLFKVMDSKKAIEVDVRAGGVGQWERKGSMDSTKYDTPTDTLSIQYIHDVYSKGVEIEKELLDDEQYNIIKSKITDLATGAKVSIEMKTISLLNNAFDSTTPIFDGKSLCADHLALDGKTTISTRLKAASNVNNMNVAADARLSDASLKAAITQMRKTTFNDAGFKVPCRPNMLIVPPALEFAANAIVQSATVSSSGTGLIGASGGTLDNTTNGLPKLEVVVMDYLISDTAWFVADTNMLQFKFFWREKMNFKQENDFNTDIYKYKGRMRFSFGTSDFRGIVGSLGTGALPTLAT